MNTQLFALAAALARFSRPEWRALGRFAGLGFGLVTLTGCVATVRPARPAAVVTAPAPTVVVREAPRTETVVVREAPRAEMVVVIREAPPPPRREVIVERERPSAAHIWIAGYWRHDGRAYVWVPGHWEKPPHPHVVWVAPRWELRGGSYVFVEGVWR